MYALDLFSGIGGFSLGLERAGMETVAFCEIDPYCRAILSKHWPGVKIHDDVKQLDGKQYAGAIDVICGGYPCQPFSTSGRQQGEADPRHLWPEMRRIIQESRPRWIISENVRGHVKNGFDTVATQMEDDGYTVWPFIFPASAIGAPHQRERLWIIAHSSSKRLQRQGRRESSDYSATNAFGEADGLVDAFQRQAVPFLCRGHDGLPKRVAEPANHALGNAVIPQIPELIGGAILAYENRIAANA